MQVTNTPSSLINCGFIGDYQKLDTVGEGTYGVVFLAKHKETGQKFAIKKMKVFDKNEGFPITSLREVNILKSLGDHPNVIKLFQVVVGAKKESVFLVFEYCDIDLYKLIEQMTIDKAMFSLGEIKSKLAWAHSNYIIHRDLKLSNLLLDKKGVLKIADFGLARSYCTYLFENNLLLETPYQPLTRKVVTLWYRAPELLMKRKDYGPQIDVWSVGCIIGQLLQKGHPLFQGSNEINQFQSICELIGYPTKQTWPQFFEEQNKAFRKSVEKCSVHRQYNLQLAFRQYSDACISLLSKMICWDDSKRISLAEALYHPFFYENPKSLFPDEIRVTSKIQFYSKKIKESMNKKKA